MAINSFPIPTRVVNLQALDQSVADAIAAANRAEVARDDAQGVLPDRLRRDISTLSDDTSLTNAPDQPGSGVPGDIVRTQFEGLAFQWAPAAAVDQHLTTLGEVKFYRTDLLDLEVTVGTGGDFSNIGEALQRISNQPRGYIRPGADVTVRLLAGFEMDEQVVVLNGLDLSYVKIVSDDAVVNASRAALIDGTNTISELAAIEANRAFFMAGNYGVLPRIGCVFSMDTDGTASAANSGLLAVRGGRGLIEAGAGFWDTDGNGAVAMHTGQIVADGSVWQRNGRFKPSTALDLSAIRGAFQAIISAAGATIADSIDCGVLLIGASVGTLRNTAITNAARHGLYTGSVSNVHARGVNITGCGAVGINATEGSLVRLIQSTISGNTGSGLFASENSVINSAVGTTISNNGGFGARITGGSRFSISTPTIQSNGLGGVRCEGADAFISGGSVNGDNGNDLGVLAGGTIRLSGTVTTRSGSTAAANIADSNVGAFNVWDASGKGAIYGRGGRSANRGTASIPSGSTSVVVTHGVDFTPLLQEVSVTPTNSMNAASKFWISNITATQFTINVNVDPGAGGASFGWNLSRIIT